MLTEVALDVGGDTFFPAIDAAFPYAIATSSENSVTSSPSGARAAL